jgi:hypothetical protein
LQTLERYIGGVYFPEQLFKQYVEKWDGIPIVYGPNHPDPYKFLEDQEKELKRVGGRIVGIVSGAEVLNKGHSRLYANMQLDDDYAEGLLNEGHLGISTGFLCADDGDKLTGEMFPNHILVFYEDVNNLPMDYGAGFLNKQNFRSDNMTGNEGDPAGNGGQNGGGNGGNGGNGGTPGTGSGTGTGGNSGAFNPENNLPPLGAIQAEGADLHNYLNLRGQYTKDMNQAKATITSLTDTVDNLKARLNAFELEERERKVTAIIEDLPKGVKVGIQEDELRERLNKNPLNALEDLVKRYNRALESLNQSNKGQEGQQYINKQIPQSGSKTRNNNQNGQPLDPRDTQGLASAFYFDEEEVN